MKRIITATLCLLMTIGFVNGQDLHFSQFNKAPLLLNPGLAGMGKGFNRANVNYRTQWGSLGNPFKTMAVSVDMPILSSKMNASSGYLGAGIDFYNDLMGDSQFQTTHFGFSLSGILMAARDHRISLGLKGSYEQRSIDPSGVSWDNQWSGTTYDPSLPSGETFGNVAHSYFNLAAGAAWKYVQHNLGISAFDKLAFTTGVSYFNMLNPNTSFYGFAGDENYGKIVGHFEGTFGLRDQYITLNPAIYYVNQGPYRQFIAGSIFKYLLKSDTKYTGFASEQAIGVGLYVRGNDAVIPTFLFELGGFELAINYDYTISTLQSANNGAGAFEISIQWVDTYGQLFKQGDKHVLYLD